MKTERTPGPWQIAQYGAVDPAYSVCKGDLVIAKVACPRTNGDGKHVPSQEAAAANAKLVAAAPDMLAALLRLVGEHADLGEVDLSTEERAALDQAHDAIDKAMGKGGRCEK